MADLTCECGAVINGGEWHLKQHQRTRRHQTRMDQLGPQPAEAPFQLVDPPAESPRTTLHRMADVLRGRHPEPTVTEAFDGVTLALDDTPPVWPRNPIPVGAEPRRPTERAKRGRPPGADDLTPLFATGLVLLTTFAIGGWAAPTGDEANAIATPLANIMARRIDLAAKLGRDASDTIALAVAVMAYSYRVIPLASERVRSSLEQRQRERVSRAGQSASDGSDYRQGQDSMVAGSGNGQGTSLSPAHDPFNAFAQARAVGRDLFGQRPDASSGDDPSVGHLR